MAVELYDVVEPRPDVLTETLTDGVFVDSLDELMAGTAFFAATYPSAGLRSLLDEVLYRLDSGRPDDALMLTYEPETSPAPLRLFA